MWLARDLNNDLYLFLSRPIRVSSFRSGSKKTSWGFDCEEVERCNENGHVNGCMELDSNMFPEIKWEDEPVEIELVTKTRLEELECRARQAPTTPFLGN